jgi:hypothetical protein
MAVLPLLAENGLVIADERAVVGPRRRADGDESTQAIKACNEHVRNDDRVVSVMLTVRDGMTLVQRAGPKENQAKLSIRGPSARACTSADDGVTVKRIDHGYEGRAPCKASRWTLFAG